MERAMIKDMLVNYMNEKLVEIKKAIEEKDFQTLKDVGHKVKGNSGSLALGMNDINDLGRVIETNGRDEQLEPCQEAYEKLVSSMKTLD